MTPQEQQLVNDLFARMAQLERAPRDPDAERLIAQGATAAPHATYALVQIALLQDEALKRAHARIEELQAQVGAAKPPQQPQGGFLDNMRDALFGHSEPHGSVPTVRPQTAAPPADSPGVQPGYAPPRPAPAMPPFQPARLPYGMSYGSGGSFLGTAASAAAGAIGGGLLLDSIRSMFDHRAGSADPFAFAAQQGSEPAQSHGDSDLAQQAGIDSIDHNDDDHDQHDQDDDHDQQDQQDQQDQDAASGSDDDGSYDSNNDTGGDDGSFDDDGGAGGDDSFDV